MSYSVNSRYINNRTSIGLPPDPRLCPALSFSHKLSSGRRANWRALLMTLTPFVFEGHRPWRSLPPWRLLPWSMEHTRCYRCHMCPSGLHLHVSDLTWPLRIPCPHGTILAKTQPGGLCHPHPHRPGGGGLAPVGRSSENLDTIVSCCRSLVVAFIPALFLSLHAIVVVFPCPHHMGCHVLGSLHRWLWSVNPL